MNRILVLLIVSVIFTNPVFAQGMMDKKGRMMQTHSQMKTPTMMKGHHMYTMMLNHLITRAQSLDLSEEQENNLDEIREKYLYPAVEKEADFKIAHMKVMSKLHDPEFDRKDIKKQIRTTNDISVELANMYIDGLAEVRSTIGIENFKKLVKPVPMMMRDGMMYKDSNENNSGSQE